MGMIWSMKTAQAEHSTEFGLFEQNLTSLVKAGKCTLVKHEIFTDKKNRTLGELYVVKRLAGRFPDYLDRPTPKELQEQIEQMLVDDADPEHTAKLCCVFWISIINKHLFNLLLKFLWSGSIKVIWKPSSQPLDNIEFSQGSIFLVSENLMLNKSAFSCFYETGQILLKQAKLCGVLSLSSLHAPDHESLWSQNSQSLSNIVGGHGIAGKTSRSEHNIITLLSQSC